MALSSERANRIASAVGALSQKRSPSPSRRRFIDVKESGIAKVLTDHLRIAHKVGMEVTRTMWAEEYVGRFSSIPLTAECVFYSPQYIDRGIQKEVCDFLLVLRGDAILVSMKAQDKPSSKAGGRLRSWVTKNSAKALNQARGALATIVRERFWCLHPRRGRVDFSPSSLRVTHVVVLTEVFGEVINLPDDIQLKVNGVPVSFLSLNDFLNLIENLRSFPDIAGYLDARTALPQQCLRMIGDEMTYRKYWMLNEKSFAGCAGHEDAREHCAARSGEWPRLLASIQERYPFARTIENVSDQLATRSESFAEGLDAQTISRYDPTEKRRNYLLMQEELCDLQLSARVDLGEQFEKIIKSTKESSGSEGMTYCAFHLDSKPDLVYVLMSLKGIDRAAVIGASTKFCYAAMAYYAKDRGMVIAERDGAAFEVQLIYGQPTDLVSKELGQLVFGKLKMTTLPLS